MQKIIKDNFNKILSSFGIKSELLISSLTKKQKQIVLDLFAFFANGSQTAKEYKNTI